MDERGQAFAEVFGLGLHVLGKAEKASGMVTPEPLRSHIAEHITASIMAAIDIDREGRVGRN